MRGETDIGRGPRDVRPSQLRDTGARAQRERDRWLKDWHSRMGVALDTLGEQDRRMADRLATARLPR